MIFPFQIHDFFFESQNVLYWIGTLFLKSVSSSAKTRIVNKNPPEVLTFDHTDIKPTNGHGALLRYFEHIFPRTKIQFSCKIIARSDGNQEQLHPIKSIKRT